MTVAILLFCQSPLAAQAPELKFRHLGNEQGLSNSTIETILQDSRGFMWFGTRDGLNKYDGYQITVYRYDALDSNSISDNYIKCLYEDSEHMLWVGTLNGLNRFNPAKNNFTRYRHTPSHKNSLSYNQVTSICEDSQKHLWIGTYGGGLNKFDPKSGIFEHFVTKPGAKYGLADNRINVLFKSPQGAIWVGTDNGLHILNTEKNELRDWALPGSFDREHNVIREITSAGEGKLWLGTEERGLLFFNPENGSFTRFGHLDKNVRSLSGNQVRAILRDSKGQFWAGSINGGLDLFNPADSSFFHYQNDPDNSRSLSQRTVSAIYEDRQGILWVGTHRGGINIYVPGAEKFGLYQQQPDVNSLSYNDVKAFCEDSKGRIWIGTDGGGLNLFDRQKQTFRYFKYDPYNTRTLGSNEVLSIMQDHDSQLWIGTWGGGLNLYRETDGSFTRFMNNPADANSLSSNYVQQTLEDSKGNLWVATYYGGLSLYNRATRQFTRIKGSGANTISGNNIVSLVEDRKGNLWIGTDDGGLNCYNIATGKLRHFFNNEEKTPDLRVLFVDSKGRLWVGQSGLYLFNTAEQRFSLYTQQAGLGSEFIKGIAEDEKGNFWVSTSRGITRFHPEQGGYKKYNTGDGLQGLEFEANAYLKTRDGQLYFGGINGFNAFYPQTITTNSYAPPVYITDLQLFNLKMLPGGNHSPLEQDISLTRQLVLNYHQSSFSFGFAALDYTAPENNQYAYKLDGWDKDWNYVGNERKATYTNLDPGTYTFHVKASNSDGSWNNKETTITIIIHPPFWKTWWFLLLVFAILFYTSYRILAFRRNAELKKISEKKREEVHQLKLQFFTNISHEFRTPLTLILGPLEKLIREEQSATQLHSYKLMQKNAYRLLDLVNEVMDFRKVESGVLQLKVMPGNPEAFLHEISEEFHEWAVEKNIRFSVSYHDQPTEAWFDNQVLEKIIYNLLSNAFKYTPAGGKIDLEMFTSLQDLKPSFAHELVITNDYKAAGYLHFRITDNGIGISKESIDHLFERYFRVNENHLGSGIGLAFVKSLTLLHKGNIKVYSERHKGTEIIISLPYRKEDYTENERWIGDPELKARQLESIVSNQRYSVMPSADMEHTTSGQTDNTEAPVNGMAAGKTIATNGTSKGADGHTSGAVILIVDDNSELRAFLKSALADDYTILEASDGQQGLEKAKALLPDIIISDVMMPVMDGITFCKLAKENLETSHIPFMMLTAKTTLSSNIEGAASGADFYFGKPLSMELLQLTIRNTLEQRKKSKERFLKDYYYEAKELVNSTRDKEFMDKLMAEIDNHLMNPDFDVSMLCANMGMSKTNLYQKIKQLTGQSTGDFVRTIRLKKAANIMTHEDVPISEVILRIGIQTQSYFTKAFKKEFGKTPTQFLQELGNR
ncbi:hybrid sensor histidine kinase/response regulator transcription factor [Filimonas effusa]|nr:hybrid sensor histidine kinase/response regulator transcription factor [Filimonas effusa]